MCENCDVISISPIYNQFGTIRKPVSGRIVCKTYILINSSSAFDLTKTENRTNKSLTQLSHYCVE